jgi:uncharacterized protein YdcH (DUF465 family)
MKSKKYIIIKFREMVVIDQVIQNDTIIQKDDLDPDVLNISNDEGKIISIRLGNSDEFSNLLSDLNYLKDSEFVKLKSKYGTLDSYVNNLGYKYTESSEVSAIRRKKGQKQGLKNTYYFINVLKNERNLSYERGSVVKALSIASKYKYVESFQKL